MIVSFDSIKDSGLDEIGEGGKSDGEGGHAGSLQLFQVENKKKACFKMLFLTRGAPKKFGAFFFFDRLERGDRRF